jgi:Ca2+-binding EF-hand superfamily protein
MKSITFTLTASALLPVLLVACQPISSPDPVGPVVPSTTVERQMIGLLEKFDRWDDDGDGQLDRAELEAGLAGTPFQADRVLEFYDTNRNGGISLQEAQAGYKRAAQAEANIKARGQAQSSPSR